MYKPAVTTLRHMIMSGMMTTPQARKLNFTPPSDDLYKENPKDYYEAAISFLQLLMENKVPLAWTNNQWKSRNERFSPSEVQNSTRKRGHYLRLENV